MMQVASGCFAPWRIYFRRRQAFEIFSDLMYFPVDEFIWFPDYASASPAHSAAVVAA
jgi:hypothetical protein